MISLSHTYALNLCLCVCVSQNAAHEMNMRHMPLQSLAYEMYMGQSCQTNKGHDAGVVYFIFISSNKMSFHHTAQVAKVTSHDDAN